MDQKPWHQKEHLDPAFPFRLWDSTLRSFSFHWHELLEIILVLKGKISVSVDGKIFQACEGDIIVVNSGIVHGFFGPEPGTMITIFQFGLELFDQSLVDLRDRAAQKLVFDRRAFIPRDEEGPLHDRLERLLLAIRDEFYGKEDGFHLAIKSRLYELALIFLRELPARTPVSKEAVRHNYNNQILERVFSFIHGNSGNPEISLEQAAEAAALSKFYFTRFFREQTGQTFHTYLSQVRINRAKEYLTESDLPVTEIAYLCGFSSIKTFNRLFKSFTGVCPSTFRSGNSQSLPPVPVPDFIFS